MKKQDQPTLENPAETMKPTQDLLEFAKEKAKQLTPHTVIRLKGGEYNKSYYLWNFLGAVYIGSYTNEKLGKFFKNKPVYDYTDNNTNELIGTMQLLTK
jgi:hypothetical protein